MKNMILTSLRALVVFTLLTGVLYPLSVTVLGRLLLPHKSSGSLILSNDGVIGSDLIGQSFSQAKYFWPRPSAVKYDAASSGATNMGPTSADLLKTVREREAEGAIAEMRFASGSGLDPHISPEATRSQAQRVASSRNLTPAQIKELETIVEAHTEKRQFGFLGEPRVNVLSLNLKLDERFGR